MLDINFDTILPAKKAVTAPRPERRKKVTGKALSLGELARLANLPDEVNEEFLAMYQDGLDDYLQVYISRNTLTLSEAARYKEYIFGTIFGNSSHLGIFQYIRSRATDMYSSEREMVSSAEEFLMKGWHITSDNGRWWLVNDALERVLDVTGSSEISKAADALVFTPSNSHVFLSDAVASKVAALARKAGFDADSLASMGQLDLLLGETDSRDFAGYLMNYNALRNLLRKTGKYSILETEVDFETIYSEGYRLGNQIFYPTLSRVILEKDSDSILLTPISDDLHPVYTINTTLLAVLASDLRNQIYTGRVIPQEISEVGELGQAVAISTEFWTTDVVRMSFTELHDLFRRLDAGKRSGSVTAGYYERARASFSQMILTETLALGNDEFGLMSFGYDSVGGKFFVYAGERVFYEGETTTAESIPENSNEFFSICMRNGLSRAFVRKNLGALVAYAGKDYLDALRGATFRTARYGVDLSGVQSFFESAREEILGAAD